MQNDQTTTDALTARISGLETLLAALADERARGIETHDKHSDTFFVERDRRYAERINAVESELRLSVKHLTDITALIEATSAKAIEKSETAQSAYNIRSNEFRATLADQQARLSTRAETDSLIANVMAVIGVVKGDILVMKDEQDNRSQARHTALQQIVEANFATIGMRFTEREKLVDLGIKALESQLKASDTLSAVIADSAEKAIMKAERAQADYNVRSNEFRGQLADQAKMLLPRAEFDTVQVQVRETIAVATNRIDIVKDDFRKDLSTAKEDLRKDIASLKEFRSANESRVETGQWIWGAVMGAMGLLLGGASLALNVFERLFHP